MSASTMINRILMATTVTALLSLVFPVVTAAAEDELDSREREADAVATTLVRELGVALKTSMAESGPTNAITVCRDIAPAIANEYSRRNGWKVTRIGTRARNPMMGLPDAWEQEGLQYLREKIDAGASLSDTTYTAVVTEGSQRYFRFMKPLVTQPLCLSCHGSADTIPTEVGEVLQQHYPFDQAIDYRLGELRGAVSIKQPMN